LGSEKCSLSQDRHIGNDLSGTAADNGGKGDFDVMGNVKNQHYVPQFCLKNLPVSRKKFGLFMRR